MLYNLPIINSMYLETQLCCEFKEHLPLVRVAPAPLPVHIELIYRQNPSAPSQHHHQRGHFFVTSLFLKDFCFAFRYTYIQNPCMEQLLSIIYIQVPSMEISGCLNSMGLVLLRYTRPHSILTELL